MNNYPRLYRLSTVNLIYHGDNDFDLNPFRTDITGNGGVGKSLVADLLRLIFIGSSEFKSATISEGERPVKTMVVKSKNRSFDFGYAVLTIEKSPNQFIGIGIYIQSNSEQAKSFIIQKGHKFSDTESLETFKTPLSCKDFVRYSDNAVLPLEAGTDENCKDLLLESKGVVLEELGHERFFKILSYNDIVPIKVSDYKDSLKIYKKIIRTFARGGSINFTKDKVLKEFLFGNEDKDKIWEHYEKTKEELEKNIFDHDETVKESDKIIQRLGDLKELLELKISKEEKYKVWLKANFGYKKKLFSQNEDIFIKSIETIIINFQKLDKFKSFLEGQKETLEKERDQLLLRDNEVIEGNYKKVKIVEQWFEDFKILDIDTLRAIYLKELENLKKSKQIKDLEKTLSEKKCLDFFKKTDWIKGYNAGIVQNRNKVDEINLKIIQKEATQAFSDLSNKSSLAYWAISRNAPLTPEQESVLIHFQTLSIQKPHVFKTKSQYLPNPDIFFNNLTIQAEENRKGFWVNLGGIIEFVDYKKLGDLSSIRESMEQLYELSKNDLKVLRSELKSWEDLSTEISKIEVEIVNGYQFKIEIDSHKFNKDLDISQTEFDDYLKCYNQKDSILAEFKDWNNIETKRKQFNNSLTTTIGLIALISDLNSINEYKEIWAQSNLVINEIEIDSVEEYGADSTFWKKYHEKIKIPNIDAFTTKYEHFIKSKNDYKEAKELLPDSLDTDEIALVEQEPTSQKNTFESAEKNYNIKYGVVANYLSESERIKILDGSYDFIGLGREILPAILRNEQILLDEDVVKIVDDRLKLIQDKSKNFITNKIKSLKIVLNGIKDTFKKYVEQESKIELFLKKQRKNENLISQEFEPIFSWKTGEIDIKWIDEFQKIEQNWNGLFKDENLERLLSKLITLDEVILNVFQEITGLKKEIKEILDPHSYYCLEYEMFNEEYKNTGISNSQNYSMVALLCIARLSIIEKKKSKGIRFMPIDEAESLGTNFDMLHEIAIEEGYQIITMSILPIISLDEINRTVYVLRRNLNIKGVPVNHQPKKMSNTLIEEDEYDTNEMEVPQSSE
jgi:hypothetical protein